MSAIQTQIAQLNQMEDGEEKNALSEEILRHIKTEETLWAAFCPATKHYFLTKERKHITAYLFTEEVYYQNFSEVMRKRHIILEKAENKSEHRVFLFAELYRCGVTQVVIDSEQEPAYIPLAALTPIPDYSHLPLVQRPVLNPTVTGKILCLMQDVRFGRANGNTELDVLQEIYHSAFLQPIQAKTDSSPEKAGIYNLEQSNAMFMIFTDLYSIKQSHIEDYPQAKAVRFGDLQKLLRDNPDIKTIIVNPGSGAAMLLDSQLLDVAEKSASGLLDDIHVMDMNKESGKIIVTKPEIWPQDMIDHVSALLKEKPAVKSAYLRSIRKEEDIRRHYLMILEWDTAVSAGKEEKMKIHSEIAKVALPYARGLDIEYIEYQNAVGKEWTGNAEPFYTKEQHKPDDTASNAHTDTEKKKSKSRRIFDFFRK